MRQLLTRNFLMSVLAPCRVVSLITSPTLTDFRSPSPFVIHCPKILFINSSGHSQLQDSGLCYTLHSAQAGLCWRVAQALLNKMKKLFT